MRRLKPEKTKNDVQTIMVKASRGRLADHNVTIKYYNKRAREDVSFLQREKQKR